MDTVTTASNSLAGLSIKGEPSPSSTNSAFQQARKAKGKANAQGGRAGQNKLSSSTSSKLRGFDKDPPEVRISKTLSWLLRHGAQGEGLAIRKDGYVKVVDLVRRSWPSLRLVQIDKIILTSARTSQTKIPRTQPGWDQGNCESRLQATVRSDTGRL